MLRRRIIIYQMDENYSGRIDCMAVPETSVPNKYEITISSRLETILYSSWLLGKSTSPSRHLDDTRVHESTYGKADHSTSVDS